MLLTLFDKTANMVVCELEGTLKGKGKKKYLTITPPSYIDRTHEFKVIGCGNLEVFFDDEL